MTTELWKGWAFSDLRELAYALELLLGAITALLGFVGVFLCLMSHGTAFYEGEASTAEDVLHGNKTTPSSHHGEVTIRLEPKWRLLFSGHRCIVTIRAALENAWETDREVWHVKGGG